MVNRDVQSESMVLPDPTLVHPGRPNLIWKHQLGIKGLLMLEHHPSGPCQFPGDGPDGDNTIRFGLFAFIEALCQRLKANCKMRRFRVGPGKVFVAGLGIACTFLFTITGTRGINSAAIRSKIARTGKAMDITGFQHDRQPEYFPNSRNRL